VQEALDKPRADEDVFTSSVKENLERFAPAPPRPPVDYILPGKDGYYRSRPTL